MYRFFTITLFIVFSCISSLHAQTTSFSFSASPYTLSGWINVSGDPYMAVRTGFDSSTGIHISSVLATNWYPYSNTNAAYDGGGINSNGFFPGAVFFRQWFQYNPITTTFGAYNALVPQLILSGLKIDSAYTLKLSGSNALGFNSNPSRYTVSGAINYGFMDLNTTNNTANGVIFHNVSPDASGNIKIYINTVVADNTEVSDISGLQIICERTAGPTPAVQITSPANNDLLAEDGNVIINATASETGGSIVKVEFFADTTKLGESLSSPYSYTWVNPDAGHYIITARAIDANGAINTSIIQITIEASSPFWSTTGNISANADTSFLGTVDTNRLAIRTNNIERLTVLGDGTVGIGTKNTFGYKLAVNGNAIFTKVRIRAYNAWPDYVFKKDYKLPGIDELEKYILLHRHLPGMTPASEVNNKGMDIADEQAALLKKIEELTLYVIKEHKNVQKLAGEVKMLRLQNEKLKQQKKTGRK